MVATIAQSGVLIGNGLECNVYDVGNGVCYKRYNTGGENQISNTDVEAIYQAAIKAAAAGLGPDVYDRDDNGYYTEIVETVDCNEDCRYCERDCILHSDEFDDLEYELEQLFDRVIIDLHTGNLGYKNGKLICIDFGTGISYGAS